MFGRLRNNSRVNRKDTTRGMTIKYIDFDKKNKAFIRFYKHISTKLIFDHEKLEQQVTKHFKEFGEMASLMIFFLQNYIRKNMTVSTREAMDFKQF